MAERIKARLAISLLGELGRFERNLREQQNAS